MKKIARATQTFDASRQFILARQKVNKTLSLMITQEAGAISKLKKLSIQKYQLLLDQVQAIQKSRVFDYDLLTRLLYQFNQDSVKVFEEFKQAQNQLYQRMLILIGYVSAVYSNLGSMKNVLQIQSAINLIKPELQPSRQLNLISVAKEIDYALGALTKITEDLDGGMRVFSKTKPIRKRLLSEFSKMRIELVQRAKEKQKTGLSQEVYMQKPEAKVRMIRSRQEMERLKITRKGQEISFSRQLDYEVKLVIAEIENERKEFKTMREDFKALKSPFFFLCYDLPKRIRAISFSNEKRGRRFVNATEQVKPIASTISAKFAELSNALINPILRSGKVFYQLTKGKQFKDEAGKIINSVHLL